MFDYINLSDLKIYNDYTPDTDTSKYATTYLTFACMRINWISGNRIESNGLSNFNAKEQEVIKRACSAYCWWLFTTGQDWATKNLSISTSNMSISQSPPTNEEQLDFTLRNVYNLLQTINLYNQRMYVEDTKNYNENDSRNFYNGIAPFGPYPGSSYPVIWSQAWETFVEYNKFGSSDNTILVVSQKKTDNKWHVDLRIGPGNNPENFQRFFYLAFPYSFNENSNTYTITYPNFATVINSVKFFANESVPLTWKGLWETLFPSVNTNPNTINTFTLIDKIEVGSHYSFGGNKYNSDLGTPERDDNVIKDEHSFQYYYTSSGTPPNITTNFTMRFKSDTNTGTIDVFIIAPATDNNDDSFTLVTINGIIPNNLPARSGQIVLLFRRYSQ